MASVTIDRDSAPAIGDVRALGEGDSVVTVSGWTQRQDAARYGDAIRAAVMNGASVLWVRRG